MSDKNADINILLGQRIGLMREQKELSQEALGEALGVSREIIQHWERGSRQIKAQHLVKLSAFFSVSPGYLLGVEDFPSPDINKRAFQQLTGLNDAAIEALANIAEATSALHGAASSMSPTKFINELISSPRTLEAALYMSIALDQWIKEEYTEAPKAVDHSSGFPILSSNLMLSGKESADLLRVKSIELISEALRVIWAHECHKHGVYPNSIPRALIPNMPNNEEADNAET